ncbi:MAG: hypothetical protein H6701_11325 [Myxococcales bacterium]|nr:hypothetical protein [Myxococcales bacterium]
MATERARAGAAWPLALGLFAFAAVTAGWLLVDAPPPVAAAPDAAPPTADAAAPPPPDTALAWRVTGRGPIDAAVLDVCLTDAGYGRALVVGDAALVVTHPGRTRPLRVEPAEDGLLVTTPVDGDARLAAALHVAVTACLYDPAAAVDDPQLDRRLTGADWPQLGARGGAPIEALVAIEPTPGGLRTRGLDRLGRPELAAALPAPHPADRADTAEPAARRLLAEAAAAAVVAPLPHRAPRPPRRPPSASSPPAAARAAGWWRGADDPVRLLADATAPGRRPAPIPRRSLTEETRPQEPRLPPAPAPTAPQTPPPPAPRPRPPPSAKAAPRRPPHPRQTCPRGFRPEYR